MSTSTAPQFSVRELQAAADALAAGRFATARFTQPEPDLETTDAAGTGAAHRESPTDAPPVRTAAAGPAASAAVEVAGGLAPLVRVRAANAGAGASTITLALADAADAAGVRTRILDAAAPAWSGLMGATATELGASEGWRRGRRGANVLIDRVEEPAKVPSSVPAPRIVEGIDLTVLDVGWTPRELAADPTAWVAAATANVEVLITRPYELALSQTEAALAELSDRLAAQRVVVVVVGASRWSDREFATAGRLLRTAHEQEAVLCVPLLAAKALPGLGPDPLPKQLTSPSQRLLERITTITGPQSANRT
ncbi:MULTISPECIES: hypothetical protein [unclassified Nocardioides]|uniref:hypothetical protein n=1 Tax=unclassified Nocardioides TaxID=2615069 RepID=UPI0009EF82B5|nr:MULTISPECIES: hypothetical protein [unclassified Nocardioides]GAW52560.1 uncharacterized protein PD653B2_4918 [Nocardioides sp. PD653-B2]GAW55601.1 uncharacterized protein PD653_3026 [Nocardioides sp. PD653]